MSPCGDLSGVNSPHKWPVTRKMFPFDDVIMHLSKQLLPWLLFTSSSQGTHLTHILQCNTNHYINRQRLFIRMSFDHANILIWKFICLFCVQLTSRSCGYTPFFHLGAGYKGWFLAGCVWMEQNLTHWGRDKTDTTLRRHFLMHLRVWNLLYVD